MTIKFIDSNNTVFDLEKCKYELRLGESRLYSQIIPISKFREVYEYAKSIGLKIDLKNIDNNTLICTIKRGESI